MNVFISSFITLIFFGAIGWLAFRRSPSPRKGWTWLAMLLITLLVDYIGTSTRLFSLLGFDIYLNDALQGLCFGILAGLLVRNK